MRPPPIQYNSPVVLTFSLLSLGALLLGELTGGASTGLLFCVYRSPLTDPLCRGPSGGRRPSAAGGGGVVGAPVARGGSSVCAQNRP